MVLVDRKFLFIKTANCVHTIPDRRDGIILQTGRKDGKTVRKFLIRYLVLLLILIAFAGAAWFVSGRNDGPYEDAVLAQMNDAEQEGMAYAGRSFISENR